MVMTVVTCFFMGVMSENGRGMQGVKGLIDEIGGLAVRLHGWLSVVKIWLGAEGAPVAVREIYAKGISGKIFAGKDDMRRNSMRLMRETGFSGQAAGLRGRRGNRIRDVSHEKGLPCMDRMGVQRQSVEA